MAVSGVFSDYIVKNYRRLLVCVAPPVDSDTDGEEGDHNASLSPKPVVEAVPPSVSAPPSPNHVPRNAACPISAASPRPHSMPASASRVVDVSAATSNVPLCNSGLDPDTNEHGVEGDNLSRWRRRRSSVRTRLPRPRRHRLRTRTHPSVDPPFVHGTYLLPPYYSHPKFLLISAHQDLLTFLIVGTFYILQKYNEKHAQKKKRREHRRIPSRLCCKPVSWPTF